jgi:ATP synthase protein I
LGEALTGPPTPRELPGVYYWRAAGPTALVTAAGILVAAVAGDRADALGVLVGGVIVLVFFGVDVLTLMLSAEFDPAVTFLLVMTEYLTKILVLAVVLVALSGQDAVDGRAVAITVGTCTVVFLTFLVIAHVRVPTFAVEPERPEDDADPHRT